MKKLALAWWFTWQIFTSADTPSTMSSAPQISRAFADEVACSYARALLIEALTLTIPDGMGSVVGLCQVNK